MLGDPNDIFYPARLVADTRLHLSTIMNGQYSEPFYMNMCKIVELKIYLGYLTVKGKEIKLKGIKDFFFNVCYGLGIRDYNQFIANLTKTCLKDKSRTKYALKFIEWLRKEDSSFNFPQELFEYRRLMISVRYMKRISKKRQFWLYSAVREMYEHHPHLLEKIGEDREYKTIEKCYFDNGLGHRKEKIKPIALYNEPTLAEVEQLADVLYDRLGGHKTKYLILKMLEICKERYDPSGPINDDPI